MSDSHVNARARAEQAFRLAAIALATLALCSCRPMGNAGPMQSPYGAGGPPGAPVSGFPPGGIPAGEGPLLAPGGPVLGSAPGAFPPPPVAPLPITVVGNWAPPGLEYPWPLDEYVRDGGDAALPAQVAPDWTINGLEVEDTIGHYDTLEGQTIVEPSNPVYIYTPRFSAVRMVTAVVADQQVQPPIGIDQPLRIAGHQDNQPPIPRYQAQQAVADIGDRLAGDFLGRQFGGAVSQRLMPYSFEDAVLPFEDFLVIRRGVFEQSENAWLAERIDAAITWTGDRAAQVIIDGEIAHEQVIEQKPQVTYFVKEEGAPRLRVIKVASTPVAMPGDIVDFTIRFDNTGTKVMGNVTIVDNLSPRLEYVEGSAQSSVEADFATALNEAGSLVLRWEVIDPIEGSAGGLVRFKCRVR